MGLIRSLVTLVVIIFVVIVGTTVPLGERTLYGHIKQIWAADETQDLVDGVKEKSGPLYEKVKRGVKAGVKEAQSDPKVEPHAEQPASNGRDGIADKSKTGGSGSKTAEDVSPN